MSWPDGECYSCHLQSHVVSVISRIYSFFSDWRHIVSSKFFGTQVPSISTKALVLLRHARCVLSRLSCNGHSLLLSYYLCRIDRIKNLTCSTLGHFVQGHLSFHSALFSYGLFAPLTFWRLSVSTTSGPAPGELDGFWGSVVFCLAPIPRKGSESAATTKTTRKRV